MSSVDKFVDKFVDKISEKLLFFVQKPLAPNTPETNKKAL